MLDRSAEIDDLARSIFLAQHFCIRDIQAPATCDTVAEMRTWMELNDFDQAPLAESNGERVILRADLDDQPSDRHVGELAINTPRHHCLDADAPLHDALDLRGECGSSSDTPAALPQLNMLRAVPISRIKRRSRPPRPGSGLAASRQALPDSVSCACSSSSSSSAHCHALTSR